MRFSSVQKQKKTQGAKPQETVETSSPAAQDHDELDAFMEDVDALLDEVSQGDTEMFVKSFQQKGGQ